MVIMRMEKMMIGDRMIDYEKLKVALEEYKSIFLQRWPGKEDFKLTAIKCFQDNWDIDAPDFSTMFEAATEKHEGLLQSRMYFPRGMMILFAKADAEAVRTMFRDLYNESLPLQDRVNGFIEEADRLRIKYRENENVWNSHYQNLNAVTTYLWLRYPDKYYIYKPMVCKVVAETLESSFIPKIGAKAEVLDDFVNLYDEITKYIVDDAELMEMYQSSLTSDCYSDSSYHTLTMDFGVYLYQKSKDVVITSSDDDWFPKDYDPSFLKEDWIRMLNNPDIFNISNLEIMKRFKDIGGQATCLQLANKYGKTPGFYNISSSSLGKRIALKTGCPVLEEDNENSKWWPILYLGRNAKKEEDGQWVWKLRDELSEALDMIDLSNIKLYDFDGDNMGYKLEETKKVIKSNNVIFHGAPGTGKTYLAKQIAADIISGGETTDFEELTDAQKEQFGFVQFHPSYDYTDFVEGLRPVPNADGSLGFELKDGTFKEFVNNARKNLEESQKSQEDIDKEHAIDEAINAFFDDLDEDKTFFTKKGSEFNITGFNNKHIYIHIHKDIANEHLTLSIENIKNLLKSGKTFINIRDITEHFNKNFQTQNYSYEFVIYEELLKLLDKVDKRVEREELKNYVFLIDEINRGEISKIFGELFFSVDPGYRGVKGSILTQYSNLHDDPEERFYIPENVYIIGTMNDIDRSVDTFDFAMRRRFRFIKLHANEQIQMLDSLDASVRDEVVARMTSLNNAIAETPELNEDYQIGAAYFLKLAELDYDFDALWDNYLLPLVSEYVRGMYDEEEIIDRFKSAYDNISNVEENDAEDF